MQTEVTILINIGHEMHSMTSVLLRMVTCSERRAKLLYCMNSKTILNLKITLKISQAKKSEAMIDLAK
jgi:hypothetical protein